MAKTIDIFIESVSEFPLSSPISSLSVADAVRKYKWASGDTHLIDEPAGYEEENHALYCNVISYVYCPT